jgi:hypothetical protein
MRIINDFKIYSLVESINEAIDPAVLKRMKKDLRVYCEESGTDYDEVCKMLNLKPSGLSKLSSKQISTLNNSLGESNWELNEETGKIDIVGSYVTISGTDLIVNGELAEGIEFGTSNTLTARGKGLTSLKGFPTQVKGDFNIASNDLSSLEGCPKIINGTFDCSDNKKITSLKGGPETVMSDYNAKSCSLKDLEGAPEDLVNGRFNISGNLLESLEGSPKRVSSLDCSSNSLKTLKGCPEEIGGSYVECSNNDLYTLESLPLTFRGAIKAVKNLFPEEVLKSVFTNARRYDSWVAAYLVLITTKRFQRMSKEQRDPIRIELSGDVLKDKALTLSTIWKDPIMEDPAIQRIIKKTNLSQDFKKDVELGSDLKDIGF